MKQEIDEKKDYFMYKKKVYVLQYNFFCATFKNYWQKRSNNS